MCKSVENEKRYSTFSLLREGKYFFFERVRRAIEWLKMEEQMMEKRLLL